jgi:serine phosphatase RsbU (regulator of sigma subunit)
VTALRSPSDDLRGLPPEQLLTALLELEAPLGFALYAPDHSYVLVNSVLARKNGRRVEEHPGLLPADVLDPGLAAHVDRILDEVVRTARPVHLDEVRQETSGTGATSYWRSSWFPVHIGDRLLGVAVFVLDVTGRRRTADALKDSRDRTARLLEAAEHLAGAVTVAEVVEAIETLGRRTVAADWSGVALMGRDGLTWASSGPPTGIAAEWGNVPRDGATPTSQAVATGRPIFLTGRDEILRRFPYQHIRNYLAGNDEAAWAVLPLVGSAGRLGVLRFAFRDPRVLDDEEQQFLRALAQQCAVAVERARLFEREHLAAASLRSSLLPTRLPGVRGLELAARTAPGTVDQLVGGDWYDAFVLPHGKLGVVVGDVMGHGLSAAAGMGRLRAALRALALTDPDPLAVLRGLDRLLTDGGDAVELATAAYAVVDPDDGSVRLGNAGHPPLVHVPAGERPRLVEGSAGTPIGIPEARSRATLRLGPGDLLVAYTDGLVESRGRSLDAGVALLLQSLDRRRDLPLQLLVDQVTTDLQDAAAVDDVTVLAVRRASAAEDRPPS